MVSNPGCVAHKQEVINYTDKVLMSEFLAFIIIICTRLASLLLQAALENAIRVQRDDADRKLAEVRHLCTFLQEIHLLLCAKDICRQVSREMYLLFSYLRCG